MLLEALLRAAVDAIIVITENGAVQLFNPGAEELFGYTSDEVVGCNVNMLMPDPDRSRHDGYLQRYLNTGQARIIGIGREVTAQNKRGETFPVELSVGQARLNGGKLFVGILRDLRQRDRLRSQLRDEREQVRELERSLAHVHRTSTLGEMAAGIAHEINQPLAAVSTYADGCRRLLERNRLEPDRIDLALTKIGEQARRAGEVVKRMRSLAKDQPGLLERRSINDVINELIDLARLEARESDAPIELRLADEIDDVVIDTVQVQQVILNLIRNGLEAMVTASQCQLGLLIITCQRDERVEVAVVDHGVGVAEDQLEQIFHPFETTKADGMGIGLSICNTIIRRHGGRLWCESNPDGGSRFVFTLPTAEETSS